MAFKGGTSLSKIYGAINRFSEDVDVTLDYRAFDKIGSGFSPEQILMRPSALVAQTFHNGRLLLCQFIEFAVAVDHTVIDGKTQADTAG